MSVTVSALFYSPIKSARGTRLSCEGDSLQVTKRGFKYDRRWLVVRGNMFVSQRQGSLPIPLPSVVKKALTPLGLGIEARSMCQVAPRIDTDAGQIIIHAPGMDELRLPLDGVFGSEELVTVWLDRKLGAIDQGKEASEWFTKFLSRERPGNYRLMRMSYNCQRSSKGGSALQGFHDGFPFMMISEASLVGLNKRLREKGKPIVPIDRFRPNILFNGDAHEEDSLKRIRIGDVVFEGRTLCERCVVTCTDQQSAEREKEPLATLAEYRRGKILGIKDKPNAVFFGRNFDHQNEGVIRVGDEIEVLKID